MNYTTASLISFLFSVINAVVLYQFDLDYWARVIGFLTVFIAALTGTVTMIYHIWNKTNNKELKESNDILRSDKVDLVAKVTSRDAEIQQMKLEKKELITKLKLERKIVLAQAAKLSGIEITDDHYDDIEEL